MTKTQKIIGTSLFSLLLVCVGMFMVCSGRSARVGNEEDYASQEELDEQYRNDLLSKLEFLESQSGLQQAESQTQAGDEPVLFVADTGDQPAAETSSDPAASAESFLTPDLFANMQSEISQLETIANTKERELQAARGEMRDVDTRVAMAETGTSSVRNAPAGAPRQRVRAEVPSEVSAEIGQLYQAALDDYYTKRYDSAISRFSELLSRDDNNSLADNCQYWIGESYFAKGDFYQAAAEFHKVYTFTDGNKQDDAQLMIGLAFMKAGESDLARQELTELMTYSKNRDSVKRAERYLRQLERV